MSSSAPGPAPGTSPPANEVEVSVLIPVLNEARHLDEAIESMLGQDYAGGRIEFLFLDGGSTDGTLELLSAHAERDDRVRVVENPEGTTPRALNLGLRAARGRFIARMDAHARFPPHYLAGAVARLARGDVASVSGPQLAVGYDRWSRRVASALGTPLGAGGARFRRGAPAEFEVDSGFCGVWERSTLLRQGGWDADWVGDEDYELAARLRAAGGRIVCLPELAADYLPRNSLGALARQYWIYGQARVRTSHRHPESLRPSQLLPTAVTLAGILALRRHPAGRPARAGVLAYLAAVLTEAARTGETSEEALALAAVLVTMHASFGLGTIRASLRYGVPVRAVGGALRTLTARVTDQASG